MTETADQSSTQPHSDPAGDGYFGWYAYAPSRPRSWRKVAGTVAVGALALMRDEDLPPRLRWFARPISAVGEAAVVGLMAGPLLREVGIDPDGGKGRRAAAALVGAAGLLELVTHGFESQLERRLDSFFRGMPRVGTALAVAGAVWAIWPEDDPSFPDDVDLGQEFEEPMTGPVPAELLKLFVAMAVDEPQGDVLLAQLTGAGATVDPDELSYGTLTVDDDVQALLPLMQQWPVHVEWDDEDQGKCRLSLDILDGRVSGWVVEHPGNEDLDPQPIDLPGPGGYRLVHDRDL